MADDLAHWLLSRRSGLHECIGWNRHCIVGFERYESYVTVLLCYAHRHTARRLGVPIYQLLGGKVRDKIKVYAWIGGDRPSDVEAQA